MIEDTKRTKLLNEAINRLIKENSLSRSNIEKIKNTIRRRAPNADGLTIVGAIDTILADRDIARDRIEIFRDELKKILSLLASGENKEALTEINHFLYKTSFNKTNK